MPPAIPHPIQEAAAAIVALINSSPRSPRQEEIEAIIARIGSVPAQEVPISDLRTRLHKAMAKADAALDASCALLDGPELAAAEAEQKMWDDEIATLEREIPSPPRSFEDLVARAEVARHGGDVVDGKLMEAEDHEEVFLGPAGRLVEAVLQFARQQPAAASDAQPRLAQCAEMIRRSEDASEKALLTRARADIDAADHIADDFGELCKEIWSVPPRSVADLRERALIARYWHQMIEPWDEPNDCDDWDNRTVAELIDAVLRMGVASDGDIAP